MARVRSLRRPKKKPKTITVSPDSLDHTESDTNDDASDNESGDLAERLEFSTDDMRKGRLPAENIARADEAAVAVETACQRNRLILTAQLSPEYLETPVSIEVSF